MLRRPARGFDVLRCFLLLVADERGGVEDVSVAEYLGFPVKGEYRGKKP
jgi:hypothetical protein